eukprot:PhM_4_TR1297/c1_g1_i5/m.58225/K01202/GALC; galactosylceramidase
MIMRVLPFFLLLSFITMNMIMAETTTYHIDAQKGPGRTFDGIGGLSGGGATSVLLWPYPEPQRSAILDYLFKPNFGASLQILKVEIGGDAQSTDGAEPSHMHVPWEEDYTRGYEWWLMKEAKKRNPNIKLYALPWAFPQWVTCSPGTLKNCTNNIYMYPEQTADYIAKWLSHAQSDHNLTIDYVGIWNERDFNVTYIKTLRRIFDSQPHLAGTKIIAPDGNWKFLSALKSDKELMEIVHAYGVHYPGTVAPPEAQELPMPLWSSEDDSTYNNAIGAACWARSINQNFVNGSMTSAINWNLIASYQKGTKWYRTGLMTAMQPWAGSYGTLYRDGSWSAGPMLWVTAHTTQFTDVDGNWRYLVKGSGDGLLTHGGSYVTFKNFKTGDVTMVVEKMTHTYSACVRPTLDPYPGGMKEEVATFVFDADVFKQKQPQQLELWETHFVHGDDPRSEADKTVEFEHRGKVSVVGNTVTLTIRTNSIYTLTTLTDRGNKGTPSSPSTPKQPQRFPSAYQDNFEDCRWAGEAKYFADQSGIWECVRANDTRHGIVMQQQVPIKPVEWNTDYCPHSFLGHVDSENSSFVVDVMMPDTGSSDTDGSVLLGLHALVTDSTMGSLFTMDIDGNWAVWGSLKNIATGGATAASGRAPPNVFNGRVNTWNTFRLDVNGTTLNVWVNGFSVVADITVPGAPSYGSALIGTKAFGHMTMFDNVQLYTAYMNSDNNDVKSGNNAVPGDVLCVTECNSEIGVVPTSTWFFAAAPNNSTSASVIRSGSDPALCVSGDNAPVLSTNCDDASKSASHFSWTFQGISPDREQLSMIQHVQSGQCLQVDDVVGGRLGARIVL